MNEDVAVLPSCQVASVTEHGNLATRQLFKLKNLNTTIMSKPFILLLITSLFSLPLMGQQQLANVANAAFENLEGQNYDLAAQNFGLLINASFYTDLSKVKKKEKVSRLKALATFQYSRAVALANLGKFADGLKDLEQAKAKSERPDFYTFYIGLYKDDFFDNKIDFTSIQNAADNFEDFPIIVKQFTKSLVKRGYYEEAKSNYEKLLKKDKSAQNYYHLGRINQLLGKESAAQKYFEKGLAAFPTAASPKNCSYQAIHMLFLEKLGRADEALKLANEILAENPKDYCTQKNKALLFYRTQSYQSAIEAYQKLVEDNPFYENGLIHLIDSFDQIGETDRALTMLNDLLKIYPNYYDALCKRAMILHKKKEFDQAFADAKKASELMPNHPRGNEIMALIKGK